MRALADFQQQLAAALLTPHMPFQEHLGVGFSVYQNTVLKGLVDALRANYPTVERLVGTEFFNEVARQFAIDNLPTQPSLALYGEAFANYLHELPEANELPYLSSVAQLDRLWLEAHFAIDAASLSAQQLQQLPAESLATVCIRLHPAARIACLPHSAATIWQANRPPALPPETLDVSDESEYVLLSRPNSDVEVHPLSDAEYAFIEQLDSGVSLGEAAMHVLQHHNSADVAAMLARFIGTGAFATDVHRNENKNSGE